MRYKDGDLRLTKGSNMNAGFNKTVQQVWDEIKPGYLKSLRLHFGKLGIA